MFTLSFKEKVRYIRRFFEPFSLWSEVIWGREKRGRTEMRILRENGEIGPEDSVALFAIRRFDALQRVVT